MSSDYLPVAQEERCVGGKDVGLAEEMVIGQISHEDCKDRKRH